MPFALFAAIARDARFAIIALRRDPLFVAVASGSLALALGVVTSVYGIVDAAIHPPSATRDPRSLVYVANQGSGASRAYSAAIFANLVRERQRVFEHTALVDGRPVTYSVRTHADQGYALLVSAGFFTTTGITPVLGRALGAHDFVPGSAPVAMVGLRVWRRSLGAQRDAIGRVIEVDGRMYTIVGVMPADASWQLASDIVLPAVASERVAWPTVIGRLRPGASADSARDQLRRDVDPLLAATYGVGRRPFRTFFRSVERPPETMTDLHKMLLAASALIVLIASANLASLMLSRGLRRRREYALRFAMGARRVSIVRQTLIEAIACALLAGALGIILAMWLFDLLTYFLTSDVPQLGIVALSLNWRVFAFAAVAAVATALLFGTYPALCASGVKIEQPLRDGGGAVTRRSRSRYSPLVVAQVALTLALLMGANLLVQSARDMRDRELGFEPRGLLSVRAFVPRALRDSIDARQMRESLLGAVEREPGVRAVATVRAAEPAGKTVTVTLPGGGSRSSYHPSYAQVSANYLATLGVRVLEGRDFVAGDEMAPVGAAVVSQAAARWFWRGENPVGQMITLAGSGRDGPLVRVVGIAEDVKAAIAAAPEVEPVPALYVVARDSAAILGSILVRTTATDEHRMQIHLMRRARSAVPPGAAIQITPYLAELDSEVAVRFFLAGVFIAFGVLALGLAMAGMFSVRAHDVAQRMREYAVRTSVGATREDIARSVLRDSLVIVLAGTGIGAFLAMYAGRQLDPWLYGVFYTDVRALVVAELVLIATTLLASLAPALRAARSSPVEILR
ncbi:MAG: ABC transporter permease [Gemmatimonadaceae bacterium]